MGDIVKRCILHAPFKFAIVWKAMHQLGEIPAEPVETFAGNAGFADVTVISRLSFFTDLTH